MAPMDIELEAATPQASADRQTRRALIWVVLSALAIRLVAVAFLYSDQLDPRRGYYSFGWEEGRTAKSLAQGKGFANPLIEETGPSAWVAPVYPCLLAGVFKVFGVYSKASAIAILSLNSLFSSLTCVPIFLFARRCFTHTIPLISAWAWTLFPYGIYYDTSRVWDNSLGAFLMSLVFLLTAHLAEGLGRGAWLAYGALWGIAVLTTPTVASMFPFLAGWTAYRLQAQGKAWKGKVAWAALALLVSISPWLARNYATYHKVFFVKDDFWAAFRVGNSGDFTYWYHDDVHPAHSPVEFEKFKRLGEFAYMQEARRESLEFLKQNPGTFVRVSLRRAIYWWTGYWSFDRAYFAEEPFGIPDLIVRTTMTLLALAGLTRMFRERNESVGLFFFPLLIFPLPYYLVAPTPPYRHTIDTLVVILAVLGASQTVKLLRKQPGRARSE